MLKEVLLMATTAVSTCGCGNNLEAKVNDMMFHHVVQGDTLDSIAKAHSVEEYELLSMNGKKSKWKIKPGDRVRVRLYPPTYLLSAEAETNVYSEILWDFRKAFYAVNEDSEIRRSLRTIWDLRKKQLSAWQEKQLKNKRSISLMAFHDEFKDCTDNGLLDHLKKRDALMPLLKMLKHVSVGKDEVLDFLLYGDDMGAFGKLMIRQGTTVRPLEVHPDGTAASAWECVLLHRASAQFYLGWHAAYGENRIVTDVRRFEEEVNIPFAGDRAWALIDDTGRKRMQKNNFAPTVELKSDHAIVTYYVFSPFGGLLKMIDRVNMTTGVVSMLADPETIVEYNCGVCY